MDINFRKWSANFETLFPANLVIESRETFVNKFLYNSTSILLGNSVVIVLFSFPFNGYRGMFGRGVGD